MFLAQTLFFGLLHLGLNLLFFFAFFLWLLSLFDLLLYFLCLLGIRYEVGDHDLGSGFSDLELRGVFSELLWELDVKDLGSQNSDGGHDIDLTDVLWIELKDSLRWTFRQFPEWFTVFGLDIQWIGVHELEDIVTEVFIELFDSILDTILKGLRTGFHHLDHFLELLHIT